MPARLRLLKILALAAIAASALAAGPAAAPARSGAPSGSAFYAPPRHMPPRHGDLIRWRPATPFTSLGAAASNRVVLYRSTSLRGRAIAVSGLVSVPRGRAPRGGWPVISWAHGTTGIADVCAPSRAGRTGAARDGVSYTDGVLNSWLRRGYAVVRTDYEGLGTPGAHPYLIGHSEARGVLDIVRAARRLDPRIGPRLVIAGHSQGGHAALFAAADAPRWVPELRLRGVIAYAPGSQLSLEVRVATTSFTTPSSLSGIGALLVVSASRASSAVRLDDVLTPAARRLVPEVDRYCLDRLASTRSWGALAPSQILRPGADTGALYRVLDAMNPAVAIRAPVLLLQGEKDGTVLPALSDLLYGQLRAKGDRVEYRKLPGVDHGGAVSAGQPIALPWLAGRLGRR